jgi:YihY family inner membrane protein
MNINAILNRIDRYQQSHQLPSIVYAIIRKYGDDNAGYLASLITYYGFLSIFPLLLAATSLIAIASSYNLPFATNLTAALANNFPLIGNELQRNVHGLHSTGVSLAIGIALALFGARGVADAFRHAINEIWQIPKADRPMFPNDIFVSLKIIFVGGFGFILSSVVSSVIQSYGSSLVSTILANLISLALIYLTLLALLLLAVPRTMKRTDLRRGAIGTALGFQALQLIGTIVVTHTLGHLNATYGIFALVLGLLFYISLQAQILVYALEYNVVMRRHLWPRSLTLEPVTIADEDALSGQAKKEKITAKEGIDVKFAKEK